MRNMIALVALLFIAAAFAVVTFAPSSSEAAGTTLAIRVSVLEERVAVLETTVLVDRANLTRYVKRLRKCVVLDEELENACTREAVREARLP